MGVKLRAVAQTFLNAEYNTFLLRYWILGHPYRETFRGTSNIALTSHEDCNNTSYVNYPETRNYSYTAKAP